MASVSRSGTAPYSKSFCSLAETQLDKTKKVKFLLHDSVSLEESQPEEDAKKFTAKKVKVNNGPTQSGKKGRKTCSKAANPNKAEKRTQILSI